VTVVTVLAMNAQANTPSCSSCVSVEEREQTKRDLFRLNAELWDLKAKHVARRSYEPHRHAADPPSWAHSPI
jgi:hypothetical protein